MSSNIILNIPHSSTLLPLHDIPLPFSESKSYLDSTGVGRLALKRGIRKNHYIEERKYMTDWYTDELYNNGIGKPLFAPVSRLLCDVEKSKDESKEEMSGIGMGICYTRTHDLGILSEYRLEHRENIIEKYYDSYQLMLTNYVAEAVVEHGCALLVNCHSFSSTPYRCDRQFDRDRPDICIGTDPAGTPDELTSLVKDYFEKLGYSVKINAPYSGARRPKSFLDDPRLSSLMIGVNRKLYLECINGKIVRKNKEFRLLKSHIYEMEKLVEAFMLKRSRTMSFDKNLGTITPYHFVLYV